MDNDLLVILIEFKKVLFLIEFLNIVVDEDIRNLIDVVEEYFE